MNNEQLNKILMKADDDLQALKDRCHELYEENERLKERVAYLERSNNRREDTIIGLRFEVAEQEDYKSRCEKASEDIEFCLHSIKQEYEMSTDERTRNEMESCIQIFNKTLNILQNGSDSQ